MSRQSSLSKTMTNAKLHHFLARSHQARFANENGGIFIYDKTRPELGIRSAKPGTEFAETHLYSVILDDGSKDSLYEKKLFSKLDEGANNLFGKIVQNARSGKNPALTHTEKEWWDIFFFYQWRRLPEVFNKNAAVEEFDRNLPQYISEYEAKHGLVEKEEKENLMRAESIKRITQNAIMTAISSPPSDEILKILRNKGLAIAVIRKHSKSFVLGSTPFLRMGPPDRSHLADPVVELWFPLSYDVAVSPAYPAGTENLIYLDDDQVRRFNKAIFRQSTKIGAKSEALLKSLILDR
jgi:hypothetical protein